VTEMVANQVPRDVKVAVSDEAGESVYLYVQALGTQSAEGEVAGGGPANLDRAFEAIQVVGNRVAEAIKAVAPDKFVVELNFEFKAEAGGLVAMLVRSGGSASIKVTMEWDRASATPGQ
jgi:Trypsin-co-occurring domain 1